VKVPLPIVILGALGVAAGVWWVGTRTQDFRSPPDDQTLAAVRQRIEASLPPPEPPFELRWMGEENSQAPPTPKLPDVPKPDIDLGDRSVAPELGTYSDQAFKGFGHLSKLASLLETSGESQRALLAWERVLDQPGFTKENAALAAAAVKRLRQDLPEWNVDPAAAIPVVIHIEAAASQAAALEEALADVARTIERASSGILVVTAEVVANENDGLAEAITPVAMRLAGGGEQSGASTEVLSFRIKSPEQLSEQAGAKVFQLLSNYLERAPHLEHPSPLAEGESAAEAMESRVTRWCWYDFGAALNGTTAPSE
jgi:hypothetical protein